MTSPSGTVTRTADNPIHFGAFEISSANGELRKDGMLVHLPRQSAQLLLLLMEDPGRICTREELKRKLWLGESYGDFDHGLNKCVYSLRAALGDLARSPRYIETLSGQGYRFIGTLRAGATGIAAPRAWPDMPMAVMPFAVTQPELAWISGQIAAQVIDELSCVPGLKVLAYSQVRNLLPRQDLPSLQEKFGVRALLVGDLKSQNDELYVHGEMVDSLDGTQMWGLHARLSLRSADCAGRVAEGIVARVKAARSREVALRGASFDRVRIGAWSTVGRKLLARWNTFSSRGSAATAADAARAVETGVRT